MQRPLGTSMSGVCPERCYQVQYGGIRALEPKIASPVDANLQRRSGHAHRWGPCQGWHKHICLIRTPLIFTPGCSTIFCSGVVSQICTAAPPSLPPRDNDAEASVTISAWDMVSAGCHFILVCTNATTQHGVHSVYSNEVISNELCLAWGHSKHEVRNG